jgi:anaerobic selenocysteine-containing dehydrogenase
MPDFSPYCRTKNQGGRHQGDRILGVRGDKDDPFSRGYICPKPVALKELYHDPERLRRPMRRTATGWQEIGWDDAFAEVGARLMQVREKYGPDSIGMYLGNPIVHDFAFMYYPILARALGSRSIFNASAIDTLPKEVQTGLMFGGPFPVTVPVPDIDRTRYLLIVGANPALSHGSLMTMPDAPGRLRRVLERGGKIVVIDPRRSETAKMASEHHFIRPGADAAFLLAIVHTMFAENLVRLGAMEGIVNGLYEVAAVAWEFAPEAVAAHCGIAAPEIRRIAREFAASETAVCYGRLGTCVQEFGLLSCWAIDLINILTGNFDRPGGAMFTTPAVSLGALAKGQPFEFARWKSRVSGQPEVGGLIPSSTMAEEILTPGDGQVRAMILLMTNPLRSAANSEQLDRAFSQLDFMVAMDFYLNETTRRADIILPTPSPAEQPNYEFGLYHLSVRNVTKWSTAAVEPPADSMDAWKVMLRLCAPFMGMPRASLEQLDDAVFAQLTTTLLKRERRFDDVSLEEISARLDGARGPERTIDMLIRLGPYGDGFGRRAGGLTLARVRENPHGIDLGPLQPRLREILNTASGKIEMAPPAMLNDIARLRMAMTSAPASMLMIGRRVNRTSNSFMHNVAPLVKGPDRCTLQISPHDAARTGLLDGGRALVRSRVGAIVAPVEITDDLMPGVVSLPHGFGHNAEGTRQRIAKEHAGVNANALTDDRAYDRATGTAVLFGTPVTIEPVAQSKSG